MVEPTMNDTQRSVSTDVALQLLADHHRRTILQIVREGDQKPVPLSVLISQLTDADATSTHHSIDPESETLVALAHNHLPKLDDHGVVEFDQTANTVAPGPEFDAVEPLLRLLETHADELPTGYVSEQVAPSGESGTHR